MVKYLLGAWAAPLVLFWGWYFLSLYDISFGFAFLSRNVHDIVFEIYGQLLGIDPDTIPVLVARACFYDSLLLAAILAFRRRRRIMAWWQARRGVEPGPYQRLAEPPPAGEGARPPSW
jgi:hypothetical protein